MKEAPGKSAETHSLVIML